MAKAQGCDEIMINRSEKERTGIEWSGKERSGEDWMRLERTGWEWNG
jgi:hypothetical protein